MNYLLLYAVIWSVELFLYMLGWSDLNRSLDPGLFWLILVTIIISIILGIKYKNSFHFKFVEKYNTTDGRMSITIILLVTIVEFIYCKQVPLFTVLILGGDYSSFTGIPVIHVLLITYATYVSYKSYYLYESTGMKVYLLRTFAIACVYVLLFSRVSLLILIFEIITVKISKMGGLRKIMTIKNTIIIVIAGILVLYLFGVTGNIRCGKEWDDCSTINQIGMYNENYPSFLSDQFKWAYTYFTSPLSNLNNGIIKNGVNYDLGSFLISFVPDVISKRLFPDYLSSIPDPRTVLDLNATAGYYSFYYYGGFFGGIIMYLVLAVVPLCILRNLHFKREQYYAFVMLSTFMMSFLFFYNVIYLSQCSFCLVYPLMGVLFRKVRFRSAIGALRW